SNRMREELSRRFRLGNLFESVERGSVTTILCEYFIRIGRENGYLDGLEQILKLKWLREKSSLRFCSSTLFELVERGVVTTVLYKIPHPIGRERSPHYVFVRVPYSNWLREGLSLQFYIRFLIQSV